MTHQRTYDKGGAADFESAASAVPPPRQEWAFRAYGEDLPSPCATAPITVDSRFDSSSRRIGSLVVIVAALVLLLGGRTSAYAQDAEPTWVDQWYGEIHTGPQPIPVAYTDDDPQPALFTQESADCTHTMTWREMAQMVASVLIGLGTGMILFAVLQKSSR